MASAARSRRQSRGTPKSYRYDQYKYLDSDSDDDQEERSPSIRDEANEDEDEDVFTPVEQDEDPEDEYVEGDIAEVDDDMQSVSVTDESVDEIIEVDYSDVDINGSVPRHRRRVGGRVTVSTVALADSKKPNQAQRFSKAGATKVHNTGISKLLHVRGVDEWGGRGLRGGSQENRLKDLFGPSHSDLKPVLQTRDWWVGRQDTLPSREQGSLRRSFYVAEGTMEREVKKMREWYAGSGSDNFRDGQKSSPLNKEQVTPYLRNSGAESMNLLMGAVADPRLYAMKKGTFMSTAEPFKSKQYRRGWVFNLGSRIQEAQWAPNEEGNTQYLAVAVEQQNAKGRHHKPLENPKAPAFTATPAFPASIQIWAFDSTQNGELDSTKSPRLDWVICTDWGAPKHFRWCPIAPADSVEDDDGKLVHLGLLAGVWSDGRLRILDISYQKQQSGTFMTQYAQYTRAAFEVQLPYTIPTCLQWLSGTTLAVGTAAGTLAIWSLNRPDTFPSTAAQSQTHNPQPWFYRQIADTFILTLASGSPSRPTYISISTADGYAKLIDLRSPTPDTATTARGRIFGTTQAWHEHTQAFLLPDEAYLLRCSTIRRYYSNIYTMRLDSQIVCCATSPVQPGVLIGGASGEVVAGNPVARVLNSKDVAWQQIWFKHEWRPPVEKLSLKVKAPKPTADNQESLEGETADPEDEEDASPQENETSGLPSQQHEPQQSSRSQSTPNPPTSKVTPEILKQPLTRMSEGYRVQKTVLHPFTPSGEPREKDAIKYITIFEEPSCVTALAWNPNLKFGTWAVAGMGSGLLRVEDLGV